MGWSFGGYSWKLTLFEMNILEGLVALVVNTEGRGFQDPV